MMPGIAVIVAMVLVETGAVTTLKVPVICPAGMVTIVGGAATDWSLERETVMPPAGAG